MRDVGLRESIVVSLDGCVHNCALQSLRFGSLRQLKPHTKTARTIAVLWGIIILTWCHSLKTPQCQELLPVLGLGDSVSPM
jgi:hypothetical protein